MNLLSLTGGCRRTFISLVSIVGLLVFGYIQDVDTSNTIASIAIALAAANGAESVFRTQKKKNGKEDAPE